MTDLTKLSNEELIVELVANVVNEDREYIDESREELLRRLNATSSDADEVDYDRNEVSPVPWSSDKEGTLISVDGCDIGDIGLINDVYHIVHCVNSHNRLVDLVNRLATKVKEFRNEHMRHCTDRECDYHVELDALIAEAGVGDAPDDSMLELLLGFDGILGNIQNAVHKNLDRDALLTDYWQSVNGIIRLRNELARKLGLEAGVADV